ncbi:MAG: hypothetical protein Q4G22_10945 [Paracoccus sp. (in: a-proteobacteria)]|nr:hypothetical protein [Paracoccus sp. (in: a-proteobacteria)]MDO5632342.1 hypothetical protein [Paracoccus sp. (in: a-proteobacteria)]
MRPRGDMTHSITLTRRALTGVSAAIGIDWRVIGAGHPTCVMRPCAVWR